MNLFGTSATNGPGSGGHDVDDAAARETALLEASLDAVLYLGAQAMVLRANPAAERLLGATAERLAGRPFVDLARTESRPALGRALALAAVDGRADLEGLPLLRADGGEVTVEVRLGAVRGNPLRPGTYPVELVAVLRDASERQRIERQLRANERMATVGTLAAGIAHEIANPTSYVLANLTLLRSYEVRFREAVDRIVAMATEGPDSTDSLTLARDDFEALLTELGEVVRESEAGGERIRGIVSDLKAFSRAEDAGLSSVKLDEELEAVLRLLRSEIRYRATVRRDYAAVLPPVTGNRGRISQLLVNLVLNALQAMERGGSDAVLTVAAAPDGEGVRVEVSDTGPGIPPEVMPHIFEPFYTTKPPGKGTGLGLSICRDIVQRHGGDLSVQSREGAGATFRLWLPLEPPATANPTPTSVPSVAPTSPAPPPSALRARGTAGSGEAPRESPASRVRAVGAGGRRLRILVVDDEPHLLAAYQRVLGGAYELVTAPDGRVAGDLLVSGPPVDLVISDLVMPDIDGPALHEMVASLIPGLERRMIFITGAASTDRASRFLDRVDNPRLEKPVSFDELFAAIDALLGSGGVPS